MMRRMTTISSKSESLLPPAGSASSFAAIARTSSSLMARTRAWACSGDTPAACSCPATSGRDVNARTRSRSSLDCAAAAASSVPTRSAFAGPHRAMLNRQAPRIRGRYGYKRLFMIHSFQSARTKTSSRSAPPSVEFPRAKRSGHPRSKPRRNAGYCNGESKSDAVKQLAVVSNGPSAQDARLAHVMQHSGMDQVLPRRRCERVLERRFAALRVARGDCAPPLVQRAREAVRDVVGQRRAREHERVGAERGDRGVLPGIAARGHVDRLDEGMLREYALDVLRTRRDETRAARRLGDDDEARAARAPGDPLALQVADRSRRAVRAQHEHAEVGIHRVDDAQVGLRPADSLERLVGDFARRLADVDLARFEERNVLGAALGVLRLDRERSVHLVENARVGRAVYGKAAAGGRGAENHDGFLLCRSAAGHGRQAEGSDRRDDVKSSLRVFSIAHPSSPGMIHNYAQAYNSGSTSGMRDVLSRSVQNAAGGKRRLRRRRRTRHQPAWGGARDHGCGPRPCDGREQPAPFPRRRDKAQAETLAARGCLRHRSTQDRASSDRQEGLAWPRSITNTRPPRNAFAPISRFRR